MALELAGSLLKGIMFEVRPARREDLVTYTSFAEVAQSWLRSQGLGQYVPAAHPEYADSFRSRVMGGTLFAVWDCDTPLAFFSLDPVPASWWPPDDESALYLGGMVVDRRHRGNGIGNWIIRWCLAEARQRGCRLLRLDCHSDNAWLRGYYESHGFILQRLIEMLPGYGGCLYQREVTESD